MFNNERIHLKTKIFDKPHTHVSERPDIPLDFTMTKLTGISFVNKNVFFHILFVNKNVFFYIFIDFHGIIYLRL